MRVRALPLEAILSIRKLQPVDAFSWSSVVGNTEECVVVPPVWLSEEHVLRIREKLQSSQLGFSYLLEDVHSGHLQKFLQHIQQREKVLILIDQLPRPPQIEVLKKIWQEDTNRSLRVTFKEGQDWPVEEGKKSLPWFLRDRVCEGDSQLFFSNDLIRFNPISDKKEVFVVRVPASVQFLAQIERAKEQLAFQFWCSPHWSFKIMRMLRLVFIRVFFCCFKMPIEYLYWKWVGVGAHFWRLKMPFVFMFWHIKSLEWRIPVMWGRLQQSYWRTYENHALFRRMISVFLPRSWKNGFVCFKAWFYHTTRSLYWQWKPRIWIGSRQLLGWALFPIIKCYWFCRYQYRKRILGELNP